MKRIVSIILFNYLVLSLNGQNQVVFNKVYNNFMESGVSFGTQLFNNDYSNCVLPIEDGYVLGGHTENLLWAVDTSEQRYDAFYGKIDLDGDTLWQRSFGINQRLEDGISVVVQRNMQLYFAGISQVDTNSSIPLFNTLFFKTDESGNIVYSNEYDFGDFELVFDVKEFGDDFLILYGIESLALTYSEPCISRIDSIGNIKWSKCLGDTSKSFGLGYMEILNDVIYLTGATNDNVNPYSFNIAKVDTNGNLLELHDYPNVGGSVIKSGGRGNSGFYFDQQGMHTIITGFIELSSSNNAGYIISVDENGIREWERVYDAGPDDEAFLSAQVLVDGRIVTTSFRKNYENGSANTLCWLVMYDKHGDLIWERFINAYNDLNAFTYPYQVKTALDDGFVVTGYVINNQIQTNGIFNRNDAWMCKTDSCGYTVGAEPLAQLTIDSVIGNQVYISNSSSEYCIGNLFIQMINSTTNDTIELDSIHLYAYSQWTNGEDPTQVVYTLPDIGTFIFNLIAYAGDGIDSFSTSILVSDTTTSLVSVNQTVLDCSVYPNPSANFIIISRNSLDLSSWAGKLYNMQGQIVHEFKLPKDLIQHKVLLPDLSNGVYIMNLENNLGASTTKKISVVN